MPPSTPRLRILSVGGNAVSAFLSWRLSATNACDVTLVWKSGFEAVAQYGITFKSTKLGNERFKPRHVVRSPEEAAGLSRASFDYVILCVKALPDVYDLASVIESVVAPQHTCILVNTTTSIGIETYLEQRFPTNVVLSLVCGAELSQLGSSEFEHKAGLDLWVGAANRNPAIPAAIQQDMAEALSMTLKSGMVDCEVSQNIRQQQYERMIGPIAFHPVSVLFENSSHADMIEKPGVRPMVNGVLDELLTLAQKQGCSFPSTFKNSVMEQMLVPTETPSIMYQDFTARRPMEVETYLGSPLKQALELGTPVPRIETLYALLHNINAINQARPPMQQPGSPGGQTQQPPQRMSSAPNGMMPKNGMYGPGPGARPSMGGNMRPGSRAPSAQGGPPPAGRRGPSMNGSYGRMHSNGYGNAPPPPMHRRPSLEGNDLEEFSHLILYDNDDSYDTSAGGDISIRERELALRQKELALREREYNMRTRRGTNASKMNHGFDDDEDDGEDYFDPMASHSGPPVDDNFDMMSVTSRRTRKTPSAGQLRANPEMAGAPQMRNSRSYQQRRPPPNKNRVSAQIMADMPNLREELMGNALVGYSSDRYGNVDRMNMGNESRTNSLTAERLGEMQRNGMPGSYAGPPPMNRRGSQSPGNALGPAGRQMRPSPPNGFIGPNGNGRPSPPGMRQPLPPHPGDEAAHHMVQQGVSRAPYPPKSGSHNVRSLTGSASASAGSGDSNRSAPIDSEPSAHSSSSSLPVARQSIGVR